MNLFLYIVSGLAVATIVTGCVLLYVGNDGTGQHTSGDRSFRAPKVGARRQVTVRLDLHRQRSANLRFRLIAGEGIREAWTSRYAPPIIRPTSVLDPLPAGVNTYIPETSPAAATAGRTVNVNAAAGEPAVLIYHQPLLEDTSLDMPRWMMRLLFCPIEELATELARDRQRVLDRGILA